MLLRRNLLITKKDDQVFGERAVDLVELQIARWKLEIDAADLGANDGCELVDSDSRIRGAVVYDMLVARAPLCLCGGLVHVAISLSLPTLTRNSAWYISGSTASPKYARSDAKS